MMTHKQRILMAARGEMPDILTYAPRIDLWYNANSLSDTLPEKHKGRTQDEISRAEGWALHKIIPEYLKVRRPEDNLHRAMNEALLVLEPYLASDKKKVSGRILMGTVRGDMHDIGKNMVITMLRGVGFEIQDMGVNVATEKIVDKVSEYKPDILGLSALLTTTMLEMKRVIDALKAKGLRHTLRVMVGGAPVNEKFSKAIGADAYGADAGEAVDVANRLMKRSTKS